MASNFKTNPLIQPSVVQATVSHVQANPIVIRRSGALQPQYPQQAAPAHHPAQSQEIPAPAPTRLLVPGAQPSYYAPQQGVQQPQAAYQQPMQAQPEAIPAPAPTRLLVPGAPQPAYVAPQQEVTQTQTTYQQSITVQTGAIPAPTPTRLLIPGTPQPTAPIQEPQQGYLQQNAYAPQQSYSPAPEQMASPYQQAPPAQTPASSDPYDQVQTPQTYEMALQQASQDPETAAFDARLTSLAQVPYYSLTQAIANHRALSPESDFDYPVIEDEEEIVDEGDDSRYSNEEKVGEGGTSIVYLANDTRLRRKVAIKRFKQISRTNDESEYLNELERTSSISHPYVVSAYDADVDRKGRFIVMEYIHGLDMETVVGKKTLNFSLNRFMNFAHKALEGLEAVHEAGLLHLDLKPSNIMLDVRESGRDLVKIIDFGRAQKITREDGSKPRGRGLNGSILYSAPEQLLSEDLDQRTDLYSLGCIFYWVLTGTRAFDGPNPVSIMSAHLRHIVTDISEIIPTLPEWLAELIMGMMSLEKEERPQSAREVIEILDTDGETEKVAQFKA